MPTVDHPEPITPAESRVLGALRKGLSNRGIAGVLVVSPRTVESHISSLLAKTGCGNRTQLLLWSLELTPGAISSAEGSAQAGLAQR
ncbi:MAG: helix-turn-helix transcriptional regulator [Cyanobium sp. M30B3]|nr:MAG: helix-turn-helix transcriptional regulator [Cyanobium sp. M30B3]